MSTRYKKLAAFTSFACVWLWVLSTWSAVEASVTVLDNEDPGASMVGSWTLGKGKDAYLRKARFSKNGAEFVFAPSLPPGEYLVKMWWPRGKKFSSRVPVTVFGADGAMSLKLDQTRGGGRWNNLGSFRLDPSSAVQILAVGRRSTSADAVMFEPVGGTEDPPAPPVDDPPAPPADLSASIGEDFVALDWSNNTEDDLAGYLVYRSGDSASGFALLADGLNASPYTDRQVLAGSTYYYFVTALDQAGNESEASRIVAADLPLPPPPDRSAHLIWQAPNLNEDGSELIDLKGFFVHVGNQPGEFNEKIDAGNVLEYHFDTLEPGTYYFSVTAYDETGNESAHPDAAQKEIQ